MAAANRCYVGFVRAVMIGRDGLHRTVLLDLLAAAGAANPVSYITTGNVSFEAAQDRVDDIVADVEHRIGTVVSRPTPVFVRTRDELRDMTAGDPFADAPFPDAEAREVVFLRDRVPDVDLPIRSARGDVMVFARSERELFSVSRRVDGTLRSPGGTIERLTGQRVTTRAWSTVTRIVVALG